MARTPEQWLKRLAKALDARQPQIKANRDYTEGRAPLPEMGKNLRESWEQFQKKSIRDFGGLAKGSLCDRMVPNGIRIGTVNDSPQLAAARRIWRDNGLDVVIQDVLDDYIGTGYGYLVIGLDETGSAIVTREKPESFYAEPDAIRPWKAKAGIKVWRDDDARTDFAKLLVAGHWYLYSRTSTNTYGSFMQAAWVENATGDTEWKLVSEGEYDGDPTIAILSRKNGRGFVEPHHGAIDAIQLGKLNRLVITAMQAFRQRALKKQKGADDLETEDQDGNAIDYRKEFSPAPGALWDLPEGFDVWESNPTDIRSLLEGEKTDARDFAALTRTPISVFIPDGANQSAEGAAAAKEGQISQAHAEIKRVSPALAVMLVYALRAEGVDLAGATLEVLWTPPEHVSLSEKNAAAAQAKAAGRSRVGILRDIYGMSPDQIAQEELDLAEEQLSALTLVASSGAAVA
ncbi:MAG: hypothetical protein Q7V58_09500 [Actinomycetota bacterium]|nr:hypothetical protein [Actinomycetota bacterium]